MHDSSGVSRVERVGDVDGERENDFHFQRTARNAVLQGHSVEELHYDKRLMFVFVDFVNCADVRMVQRRGGLCFALEAA